MLNPLTAFLILLVVHFVADFMLQTRWQAVNKSKNSIALFQHVVIYTICLFFTIPFIFTGREPLFKQWLGFFIVNGCLHFMTDYCTSRWSSKLYAKQDWHNFFVVIGFDQLIHQFTLALIMLYFFY